MSDVLPDDLESRIFQLLDGELGESAAKQLDLELQNSAQARELYLKTAALHSALQIHHQSRKEVSKMPIISAQRLLKYQHQRLVRFSIAAAAIFVFATVLWWMQLASASPRVLASFKVSAETDFALSHAQKSDVLAGNVMCAGSKLVLKSGMIEAEFSSGARCVIEAPGELVVLAEDRVLLKGGVSRFEVPPRAVGFTVETPKLKIVDLGTEFGVIASLNGQPEVHVINGSIELGPIHAKNDDKQVVLKAGQARRLDTNGDLLATPYDSRRFSSLSLKPLFVRNAGFEISDLPDEQRDMRGYGALSHWATSGSGIGRSDIHQPFLRQPAKSGEYAAFIQGNGTISQTVSGFDSSKLYSVTYFVSERGLPNASTITSVSLDLGASVYNAPHPIIRTEAFRRIVSAPLAVFGPTANIQISAKRLTGDASLLVDSVSISRAVPSIPDGGFEYPVLRRGHFKQASGDGDGDIGSSSWKFSHGAGMITNSSDFQSTPIPEGSQAAVLQSPHAKLETSVTGFEAGVTYSLSLEIEGRKGGACPVKVMLDDQVLSFDQKQTLTPGKNEFTTITSDFFKVGRETVVLSIEALGEGATFIDDLRFNFVAEAGE